MSKILYRKIVVFKDQIWNSEKPWNAASTDLRQDIIRFIDGLYDSDGSYLPSHQEVVVSMSFTDNGTYYCVFRCVQSARPNSHQAIWLFVPNDIELKDPKQLYDAINSLKEYIKKDLRPGEQDETIDNIVSEIKYESVPQAIPIPANCQKWGEAKLAFRKATVQNSFSDIIKKGYQTYYNDYKAILLFDKDSKLTGKPGVDDLSDKELKELRLFTKHDLNGLPGNVSVYKDGSPFQSAFVETGSKINLEFRKDGFKSIEQPISVDSGEIQSLNWQFEVKKEMFLVSDDKTRARIPSFRLYLGDQEVLQSKTLTLFESELKDKFKVQIVADGYKTHEDEVQFTISGNIRVYLNKEPIRYYFTRDQQGYLFDKERIEVVFPKNNSNALKDGMSPIWGWVINDGSAKNEKKLVFDEKIKATLEKSEELITSFKRKFIVGLILACVVGLIGGFAVGCFCQFRTHQEPVNSGRDTTEEAVTDSGNDDQKTANNYLSTHAVWKKSEMEQIEELKGVWDKLNTFNPTVITRIDNDKKFTADNWKRIVDAINKKKYQESKIGSQIFQNGDSIVVKDKNSANTYLYKINETESAPEGKPKTRANKSQKQGGGLPGGGYIDSTLT